MLDRPTRILVIRFSSIGDIVLTAPALASLKEAIEGPCELHFLTKATMRSVIEGMGDLVQHIHTIDQTTSEVMEHLRDVGIDYVVDLHNNVRSRSVKRSLKLISFTVDKQNVAKWLLVRGWRKQPIPHVVERYIHSFSGAFGAKTPDAWPPLFTETTCASAPDEPFAVIAIGATHAGKRLNGVIIDQILQQETRKVVLVGGPDDREQGEAIRARHPFVLQLAGTTTLAESAALMREAEHVYAGDTGMMHLAAALGTAVTSFWGCTRPGLGMAPWKPAEGSEVISPDETLGPRPCSKLGNRSCRHTPSCMERTASEFLVKQA